MIPECHGRKMLFMGVVGSQKEFMKYECTTCNQTELIERGIK